MTITASVLSYQELERLAQQIDANDLENEMKKQLSYYLMICEQTALFAKEVGDKKQDYDQQKAKFRIDMINTNRNAGKKDPTVDEKDAAVDADTNLHVMKKDLINTEYNYQRWFNLRRAFEGRQDTIENMVKMVLSGYIACARPGVVSTGHR